MPEKQNLVILANPFVSPKGLAGGDLFYIELAKYLNKKYQVSVILPKFAKIHWQNQKVKFIFLKPNIFDQSEIRIFIFFAYLIRTIQSSTLLQKFPEGTIVCSSSDFLPDVLPIVWAKIRGGRHWWIARFYHLIDTSKRSNKTFAFLAFLLQRLSVYLASKKADLILVDNKKTFRFFCKKGVQQSRLLILGGGVDFLKLAKYRKVRQKVYDAVFAGRLDQTKGAFDLPPIWAKVVQVRPSARLAIVGTATDQNLKKIKSAIVENKIEKNVELLGFLPHRGSKTIFDIFAQSKIFLSLTLEGGRDFVLIEALACGLPVVSYDQDFLREGVVNNGLIKAPSGDKVKVAQIIIEVLQNERKRTQLAKQAALEAQKFDWGKTYQQLTKSLFRLTRS